MAKTPLSEEQKETAIMKTDHSKYTKYPEITGERFLVIRKSVFKDFDAMQTYFALDICHAVQLNPFLKEIWGWIDNKGRVVMTTGIAGYKTNASRNPDYKGLKSAVVYEGDEFAVDYVSAKVTHVGKGIPTDTKKIIGAWALCSREGFPDTLSVVNFKEYKKSNAWDTNPSKMILKVAEGEALAKQFPINGIVPEWETTTSAGQTDYVNHTKAEESEEELHAEELREKILEALEVHETYDGDDADAIANDIRLLQERKELTVEQLDLFIDKMKKK